MNDSQPIAPWLTDGTKEGDELLERATLQWMRGDWRRLADIDPSCLQTHPARVQIVLFAATGHLQCGNATEAEKLIALALQWGAKNDELGRILIFGAYNSLGRAMALADHPDNGLSVFERSFAVGLPHCDARSLAQRSSHNQFAELGLVPGKMGRLQLDQTIPHKHMFACWHKGDTGSTVQIGLSTWALPSDCGFIRQPTRAPDLRHGDFWERYDATTVIYDLFRTADPEMLLAICPPLHNLEQDLALRFRAEPSGEPCRFTRQTRVNCDRLWISVPRGTERVVAETTIGEVPLIPGPDMTDAFRDRRVVFTLSKDNDLVWIRDWAAYYARVHGVDAVVVYDNGSTRYSCADIEAALATVPELAVFAVIDWPFRYGPADYRRDLTVGLGDCDYCQAGALEHAARRMFSQAAAVINMDIDELLYAIDDIALFDALRGSQSGYLHIHGHWVEATPDNPSPTRRHAAYSKSVRHEPPLSQSTKWVVDPRRLHPDAFWDIHHMRGADVDRSSVQFRFGHFRALNTNWDLHVHNTVGTTLRTEAAPENDLEELPMLRGALDLAFSDRDEGFVETPVSLAAADTFVRKIHQSSLPIDDGQLEGHTAQYWYQRGMIIVEDNFLEPDHPALDEATRMMRRAVEAGPSNLHFLENLAFQCLRAHKIDLVWACLDLARPGPDPREHAYFHAMRAFVLLKLDKIQDASEAISTAIGNFQTPGYFFLQAQIFDRLELVRKAEGAYRNSIHLASDRECLALLIEDTARRRYAVGQYGQSVYGNIHYPEVSGMLMAFARFLLRRGRSAEAEIVARKVMASEPLDLRSHLLLATCQQAQENADGLRQTRDDCLLRYHQLYQIGPLSSLFPAAQIRKTGHMNSDAAIVLLKNGELDAAMGMVDQVINEPIIFDSSLLPVISELVKMKRMEEAHRLLLTITERRPDSIHALDLLMRTSRDLKDVDTARWAAGRLVELRPNNGVPMAILGNLLMDARHKAEGIDALRDAVKREPDRYSHHSGLYWALVSASRHKEAEAQLLEIVYRFPEDPKAHMLMAKSMRQRERPELARLAAQHLLALQPGHADARKLLEELGD